MCLDVIFNITDKTINYRENNDVEQPAVGLSANLWVKTKMAALWLRG